MSAEYIEKEITKVLEKNNGPLGHALASAWVIANFKGLNIKVFDTSNSSSLCDYNIIASAENTIQAKSMIAEIEKNLRAHGADILSLEGLSDGEWILLDIGDIIVHIFQEVSRDAFDLDDIWRGAPQIEIPNEYYFGTDQGSSASTTSATTTENYF